MRPSRNRATAISLAAFSTTGRLRSASSARYASARQGNASVSGTSKSSRPARARSSGGSGAGHRSGIRERVLDRQPHVGDAQLRDHRAVDELHHRVHDRLRMDHDVDLIGADAEQPVRLDHLEALVHQRRRIDRDLPPHPPRRMLQRVVRRDACEFRRASGRETVRPMRSAPAASPRTRARPWRHW